MSERGRELDDTFGIGPDRGQYLMGRKFRELSVRVSTIRKLTELMGGPKAVVRTLDAVLKAAVASTPIELDSALNDLMAEVLMWRAQLHRLHPDLSEALSQKVERRNREGRS